MLKKEKICWYCYLPQSLASKGYTWFRWGPWWLAQTCCSHTCYPPPPWRDYCWGSAGSQRTCQSQHRRPKKTWKDEDSRREGEQGAWARCQFPCVSEDLCYECSHSPLVEERRIKGTPLDLCQTDDLSHRQLSIDTQRHRQAHTYEICTHTTHSHSTPLFFLIFLSSIPFFFVISYPSQAQMKCCQI